MELLPFHEINEERYAEQAAATFTVIARRPGTLVLSGPCPRCTTVIQVPVVDGVYKTVINFRSSPPDRFKGRVEPVICTCDDPHPGRPESKVGCGAYWLLHIVETKL